MVWVGKLHLVLGRLWLVVPETPPRNDRWCSLGLSLDLAFCFILGSEKKIQKWIHFLCVVGRCEVVEGGRWTS